MFLHVSACFCHFWRSQLPCRWCQEPSVDPPVMIVSSDMDWLVTCLSWASGTCETCEIFGHFGLGRIDQQIRKSDALDLDRQNHWEEFGHLRCNVTSALCPPLEVFMVQERHVFQPHVSLSKCGSSWNSETPKTRGSKDAEAVGTSSFGLSPFERYRNPKSGSQVCDMKAQRLTVGRTIQRLRQRSLTVTNDQCFSAPVLLFGGLFALRFYNMVHDVKI